MKAIVVGSGSINNYERFLEYVKISDMLICCDGGVRHFYKCGIVPDVIIGDLDSADEKYIEYFRQKNVRFEKFPPEKDFTDMELGIHRAIDENADEIFLFAGTGTRLDHTFANAQILKKALDKGILAWLVDEKNKICLAQKYIKIKGKKGDLLSLIPLTTRVSKITTKGLYYALDGNDMEIGNSLGVSNVMLSDECEIYIGDGILFVIMSED